MIEGRAPMKDKKSEWDGVEPRLMGVPISEVMEIFAQAGREAYARHKMWGVPVVIWRDGKVVEVPPEDIEVRRNKNSTQLEGRIRERTKRGRGKRDKSG